MTKIIDIPGALERIEYDSELSGRVILHVDKDTTAPWNVGTYALDFDHGKVKVSRSTDQSSAIPVSIQTLSDMFMGYRSVSELIYDNALAHPGDALDLLDRAFPKHATYIEDWF
jgi:predicted acetyltransferase